MSQLPRRTFLSGALASVGAPIFVRDRAAAAERPSRLQDIDHFIILMQENRSFDHYFGTLSGVRGFDDAQRQLLHTGRSVLYQPDDLNPDRYTLPFHLDTTKTSAEALHSTDHDWYPQHASWHGGAMDNWLPAHRLADGQQIGPLTMGYFTRADLRFYYELADAFTICDGYHCSVLGPTYPNRVFSMTGSIDPSGRGGGPVLDNSAIGGGKVYTWETYPERLQRAGISWQIFYDVEDDYLMNILRLFPPYQTPGTPLFRAARTNGAIDRFLDDLRRGNLPQVTWVLAHGAQTEHPDYLPATGANFVRTLLEALWSNPKVWARTAFLITYDENDGLFDHVAPPVPEPGTPGEFVQGLPIGLGFRVPGLVISPFSRGGYVCSDTFDHTSMLLLLEARFGVEVPNISAWRRRTVGDMRSAFGFGSPPRLDVPALPATWEPMWQALSKIKFLPPPRLPRVQTLPVQEPGTRPRRGAPPAG